MQCLARTPEQTEVLIVIRHLNPVASVCLLSAMYQIICAFQQTSCQMLIHASHIDTDVSASANYVRCLTYPDICMHTILHGQPLPSLLVSHVHFIEDAG